MSVLQVDQVSYHRNHSYGLATVKRSSSPYATFVQWTGLFAHPAKAKGNVFRTDVDGLRS